MNVRGRKVVLAAALMALAVRSVGGASPLYGPVADSLQNQTHSRFWNGTCYRENNGGSERFH